MEIPSRDEKSSSSDVTRLSARSADSPAEGERSVLPDRDVLSSRERLGDFRLIRQIGHGGMGVVYEAEQLSLSRKVAVKVLPFASMLNPQHRKRFHNEARAAATLDHPNIVPIYFVGEERGVHFYAMHLIEGQSIADLITAMRGEDSKPTPLALGTIAEQAKLSPTIVSTVKKTDTQPDIRSNISTQRSTRANEYFLTVASLGAQAADALEHAHQVGILHRDIKPGNLMVDTHGKLWITDFGLASIEHGETLTRTGGVVGTAAYMSPEQAADSHHVDNRTDIFSLGATLYEMLTLRKHRSDDITRTDSNRSQSNVSIPLSKGDVPTDLETIIFKALADEPADRYGTAQEMANDLRAFVEGREIKARRLTVSQRLSRWMRRHRRLTTAATVASFLMIALFGTFMWFYSRQLSSHASQLEHALEIARNLRQRAEQQSDAAQQQRLRAEKNELLARRTSYRGDMQRAYESFAAYRFADVDRLLQQQVPDTSQPDLRGIEWKLLRAEIDSRLRTLGWHNDLVNQCVLFPDGQRVATAGLDGVIKVWNLRDQAIERTLLPKIGPIHALAVSPDGKTLAVAGPASAVTLGFSTVHLLDSATGDRRSMMHNHRTTIESVAFSPDGNWIASASRYGSATVSKVSGKRARSIKADTRNESLAFSPDSKFLATQLSSRKIRIWELDSGDVIQDVSCGTTVDLVRWSPTGDYIVAAGDSSGTLDLIETTHWQRIGVLSVPDPQPLGITALTFADDGATIVAGDFEGQVHRWSLNPESFQLAAEQSREAIELESEAPRLLADSVCINEVVHLQDGNVITVHDSGSVKFLMPEEQAVKVHRIEFDVTAASMAKSSDSTMYLGLTDGSLRRWNVETGQSELIKHEQADLPTDLQVCPDDSRLVVAYQSRRVELIDTTNDAVVWSHSNPYHESDPVFRVALSDDASYVGRTGDDLHLAIWDTRHNESVLVRGFSGIGYSIAFSPLGNLLAHGRSGVKIYQIPSGRVLHEFANVTANEIAFSPDEQQTASAHEDGSIRLFDLEHGRERILRGHTAEACAVEFVDRGRTLLSADIGGSRDSIRLWDADTGEAFGAVANPLRSAELRFDSTYEIFVTAENLIVCNTRAGESFVAVWDLPQ